MAKKILNEQENINLQNEAVEDESKKVELTKMSELEVDADGAEDVLDDTTENTLTEEKPRQLRLGVLKIRVDDSLPEDDEFETMWNELMSVYRAKKTIPVTVTGIEKTQTQGNVVVTYYKTQRIIVPMTEMMINLDEERGEGYTVTEKLTRVCNAMLGCEIDVIIKGMDKANESIVASRKDAMNRKRQRFHLTPLSDGLPQVRVGRIVEARIVGTTQNVARLEVFGVETTLPGSQLSWDWIANVSEKFHVGDTLDVLITETSGTTVDDVKVVVDVKSITRNISKENLNKCAVQNKYIGEVTNVRNGVAYIRLKIGVNAIAHTNYDRRTPARGDIVSFVIVRINPEFSNVSGIITKIIKQSV